MNKRFWMYLEVELHELKERFEKLFQVDDLYRDYENVWEWIESSNKEGELYLNISRSHNWTSGNYNEPINIFIKINTAEPINDEEIGFKLLEEFKVPIYFGELEIEKTKSGRNNYIWKVEREFK